MWPGYHNPNNLLVICWFAKARNIHHKCSLKFDISSRMFYYMYVCTYAYIHIFGHLRGCAIYW